MKLIRLKMVNFKKFRRAEIEFQDGLTGIVGNNGAGKSTIVEAILWSLYGNRALSIKKDFLKNNNAAESDQMSVKLVLEQGNQEWSIYRGMKPNGQAEAILEINHKRTAWSVKDVDDILTKRLHTSAQDFKKTFYARQKDLDNLVKDGGPDKKEYLLKLLNLSDIKPKSIDLIKVDKKDNEGKRNWIDGALKTIGDVGLRQEDTQMRISKAKAELDELGKDNNELVEAVKRCEIDYEMHSRKEQSYEYLAEAISKQESSVLNKRNALKSENCKIIEIEGYKKRLAELDPDLERYSLIKSRLEALESLKSSYETIIRKQGVASKQFEGIERLLKENQERLSALRNEEAYLEIIKPNEDEYNKLKSEIPAWEKIRDDYNAFFGKLNEENINTSSLESRILKVEKNLDELMKTKANLCKISPLKNDYDALQETFSSLKIKKDLRDRADAQKGRMNALAAQISKLLADENAVLMELSRLSYLAAKELQFIAQEMDLQTQGEKINGDIINLSKESSVCQSKKVEARENLERIRSLGTDGTCPTCERPLGEQHEVLCRKYEHEISEAERMGDGFDAKIRSLNKNKEENSRAKADLKKAFDSLHQDKANYASLEASLAATRRQKAEIQVELDGINNSLCEIGAEDFDQAHLDEVSRKIQEIGPKISDYDSLRIRLEMLPNTENELKALREDLQSSFHRSQDLKERLKGLGYDESKYVSLKKRKSELEADHEKFISINQKIKDIPQLEDTILGQKNELEDSRKACQEIDQSMKDLGFNLGEYEALYKEKKNLAKWQDEAQRIRLKLAPEAEIRSRRDDIVQSISDLEKEIEKAKHEVSSLGYDAAAHQKSKSSLIECKKKLEDFSPKLSDKMVHIGVLKSELEKLKEDEKKKKEYEQNRSDAQRNLEMLDIIRDLLDGFLDQLLIRIRKDIQKSAGKILEEISGKYSKIMINDEFNICVEDDGRFYPTSRYSGGEIDMIAVSVRIAISEYLMHQETGGTAGFSFLILDEIFGSQDLMHRDNMINTLRKLDSRFPQVIVISHIGDVQGQFDNIINVTENEFGDSIVECN